MKRENIKVSCVIGTSMGAIIGAAYCLGIKMDEMEQRSKKFTKRKIISLRNINVFGGSILKPKILESV